MKKMDYLVCGETNKTEEYVKIINPQDSSIYGEVPALTQKNIDSIYKYAKEQQRLWQEKTISERSKYLLECADLLLENKEELALTLVNEIAKNYQDSIVEVERTVEIIKYTVEEMYRLEISAASGEQFYGGNKTKIAVTKRIPMGVILAISPFNYPINLAVAKIAPALISGNTVVFKPATQGSIAGIKIIKLLEKTGIPNGIVNLVTGYGREIGDYLVQKDEIDMVSFTGGTDTGRSISQQLTMTPQVMELGGKDAAIILEDSDLELAVNEIIGGAFNFSAQRCTAIKRVLVPKNLVTKIEQMLKVKIENLTVGMPQDNATIVPLISKSSADYVEELIEDAKKVGNKILIGGKRENNLIYPTLITDVKRTDRLALEEPFGPVLPIIAYETIEEAIEIHNESEFGLQASIFGNNINEVLKISPKLEAGTININAKTSRGPDNFPFSGYKNSGVGVQGIKASLLSMTKSQTTVVNIK
ncbi:MAG: aldehyde dehydrogenase family protein [Mycoplasmatales bacterium]